LRERLEDVPALVERFLAQLATRLDRPPIPIDEGALRRLARHPWPGNVRELRNVIEQAAVLAAGEAIVETDLKLGDAASTEADLAGSDFSVPFTDAKKRAIESFERGYLREALRRHDGNVSRTAEAIGMARQSLQQKMRELGLRSDD
jgi:DNA-binding NtrC family response regulator